MSASSSSTFSTSSPTTSLALAISTATDPASFTSKFFTDGFTSSVGAGAAASTQTSDGDDNNGPSLATSSSLYLFTFLATLLLLLAVSCAIVVRSFVIRRRFHRRVQEALAEGIVLPPQQGGRRRPDFGEKPRLWDAHLLPPINGEKETNWESMMPVSVRILSSKLTGAGQQLTNTAPLRSTFLNSRRWRPRLFRSRSLEAAPPSPAASLSASPAPSTNTDESVPAEQVQLPETVTEHARIQVNVLVAMPSPYRPRTWLSPEDHRLKGKTRSIDGAEDDELPDVVLGTTEVPWNVSFPSPAGQDSTNTTTPSGTGSPLNNQ